MTIDASLLIALAGAVAAIVTLGLSGARAPVLRPVRVRANRR